MNRILLTVIVFLSSQLGKINGIVSQFLPKNKDSRVWSLNGVGQNWKGVNKSFAFLLVLLFTVSFANAATRFAVATGNWNSALTWSATSGGTAGASVPVSTDVVYIESSLTVTVIGVNAACLSLEFLGSGTLNVSTGFSLNVTNGLVIDSSNGSNRTAVITGGGTFSCASLSVGNNATPSTNCTTILTSTISNFNITGDIAIYSNRNGSFSNDAAFYLESGIVNVDGQITTTNESGSNISTLSMATGAQSGTLLLGNATPFNLSATGTNTIALNGTGSTVNYDRAGNQTVRATTYNNLTLSGSGTKTFAAFTVINNLTAVSSGVQVNLNAITTHTTGVLTLGAAGPLSSTWGATGSGAVNTNNTYFTGLGRIIVNGTAPGSAIDHNFASYSNATADLGATVGEYTGPLRLTAPNGTVFINTKFASYGLPNGTYPNFTIGSCHATNSRSITTGLLGNTTATIGTGSFNSIFPDPCYGTSKFYSIVATYAEPICSGTNPGLIDGSTPTGGMGAGSYTFLWEQSAAVNGTYTTVTGTSNAEDYTPSGTLSATTYYRRTVTSGIYSDATIVIVPVITAPASAPTISKTCGDSTLTVPASSISGTYTEWFTDSCGGTLFATGNSISPTVAGTYYARYKNRCGESACGTTTIGTPTYPIAINTATTTTICTSTSISNSNLTFTLGSGTASTYSIVWDRTPTNYLLDIVNRTITSPIVLNVPANTPAGTFTGTLTVKTSGGCISAGKVFTLTVGNVASVASSTPTLCINTVLTAITHSTINATGISNSGVSGANGLPSGVSATWSSNNITITGTPTVSGTFNYSIPLTGTCAGPVNATGTITVNPLPIAPVLKLSQPNCVDLTGTITVSSPAPAAGTLYTVTGTNPVVSAVSNDTGVFSGLLAGDYTVTYQIGTGCVSSGEAVSLIASSTNTWNGTVWSGGTPTATQSLVFAEDYSSATSIIGCSCEVAAGKEVTIQSGGVMTITNSVTNNGGTLIFENNSSLVQLNDAAVNTGKIIYKRTSSQMKDYDYTYWCSPVGDQKLNVLSPNSADYYYSFGSGNWVHENGVNTMNGPGKGFIIRVPRPGVTYANLESWMGTYKQPVQFEGTPYNGIITIATQGATQNNLIGNPYPSAIDADDFIINNSTIIDGALYFWTHNTARQNVGSQYVYSSNDYATLNLTGGTTTVSKAASGGKDPSVYIAAGQAFFVKSKTAGNFEFNNSMRVSSSGSNSDFFKMANTKKTAASAKSRVWLNLSNAGGAFKQILVGYVQGATNDLDNLYDGTSFNGNAYVDFYSINNAKSLTIQGRSLPFEQTDQVALGYKTSIEGVFEISIDQADGVLANQSVYLEDKTTNVIHNLKDGAYSFSTLKGEFKDRFVLRYASSTLGTGDFEANGKSVIVSVTNHQIKINSFDETIAKVKVYDMGGRLLYEKEGINKNEFVIENLASIDQFLIVSTQLANGQRVAQKVLFKN